MNNTIEKSNTGLTEKEKEAIIKVFSKYPEIEKVILYGSRAMGNFKPASDIDLSLVGDGVSLSLLSKIETDLDDLLLPYKFDISIYNKITNPEFLDHINGVGKSIYTSN